MDKTICGIDCNDCGFKENCAGCVKTNGHPFGGECMIARCCQGKGHDNCVRCAGHPCELKEQLIAEFNALVLPIWKG
ncbi:MAG: DUF3795 domain-containing protein [Oscillospiraceae bacterium]|nr:DUF3795 domain-containing protein [Oscillospiraceae bacterium]